MGNGESDKEKKTPLIKDRMNLIPAAAAVVLLIVIAALLSDFTYDLNDDVLMKDILSGAYTGVPEARNIQMLFPLSALIAGLYRLTDAVPWYGLFLLVCQFGSLGIILYRILEAYSGHEDRNVNTSDRTPDPGTILKNRLWILLFSTLFFGGVLLSHLVFLQYTITVAILSGAAMIWFMTSDTSGGPRELLSRNIPALILIFIAFLLRSEMLLLMMPFICVAGISKWAGEEKIFTRENALKYFSLFGVIILLILLGLSIDNLGYNTKEWQEFRALFDARTELYDFQNIPPYEGNERFYEGIGLSKEEQILLENYNYGLSDKIDARILTLVAEHSASLRTEEKSYPEKLREGIRYYLYRLTHLKGPGTDRPYNALGLLLYLFVLLLALGYHRKTSGIADALTLGVLFLTRTLVWMYIILGGREPDRITHSLYFAEFCILFSLLIKNYVITDRAFIEEEQNRKKNVTLILYALICVVFVLQFWFSVRNTKSEDVRRLDVNAPYEELCARMRRDTDSYYLLDVYSTVAYSEKVFRNRDDSFKNYDILGGWACFSPVQRKKLARGIGEDEEAKRRGMEDALLGENVYFVRDKEQDMDWLPAYYDAQGIKTLLTLEEEVAGRFEIFKVERQ
ncbi:MAG: hypothetical protein K6F53_06385 [Lachnospiraceae bacterium]|nr:hypothetical protein [Lachnospiraceae bacterium]